MGTLSDVVRRARPALESPHDTLANILFIDIETTHLDADFGWLLGFGWSWLDEEKISSLGIHQTKAFKKAEGRGPKLRDDSELVKAAHALLLQADQVIYHYGDRFDLPYLKTRMMKLGLYLPKIPSVDTWRVAKDNFKFRRNSLANIATFVGGAQKGHEGPEVWMNATVGHVPSIKKIMRYCELDVQVLRNNFEAFKPYCKMINQNLFHNGPEGCPTCKSTHYHRKGWQKNLTTLVKRYQCQNCGRWFYGKAEKRAVMR